MNVDNPRHAPRRVLVTGAGSGIGRAVSLRLARDGAAVALLGRRIDLLHETQALAPGHALPMLCLAADVADESAVGAALGTIERAWGGLDGLVNNAGQTHFAPIAETSIETWESIIGVNLRGPFVVLKAALPLLMRGDHPSVVNIGSTLASYGLPGAAAYCASKGGLVAMTRAAAMELAASGIRVNAVNPGPVDTAMLRAERNDGGAADARRERLAAMHPLGRLATPDDVAHAIAYLLSSDAAFVTGTVVTVDGGLTSGFRE